MLAFWLVGITTETSSNNGVPPIAVTIVNFKLERQPRPVTPDLLNGRGDVPPRLLRVQSMPIRIGPIQRRHKINKGTSTFG